MVLILSEDLDDSTTKVIEWLHSINKKYIRINFEDLIKSIRIKDEDIILQIKEKKIKFNEIDSFWFRRGRFNYEKFQYLENLHIEHQKHLIQEWEKIDEYLIYNLNKKKGIYNYSNTINKLIVLDIAKKNNLLTPQFFISDTKLPLYDKTVVKAISDTFNISDDKKHSCFYTESIEEVKYDNFFTTLFQQKVESKYEIRSVFIKDKCWSMAIHNPSSNVDFRKNYKNLRYSPYKLPKEIEINVFNLMQELGLNFGAVDFIVDNNNNHFFLEINPLGQFGMVSTPCNYYIEREIAKILTE